MTLIDCLKSLFREDDLNPLSPEELRVYIDLLKMWNSTGRDEWFECALIPNVLPKPLPKMLPNVLPKMTVVRVREKLQKRGLIQYVSGNGKAKKPYYKICGVTNVVTKDVTNPVTNVVTNSKEKVSPIPPLKENISELREKERISNDIPKKDKLSSPTPERMDWVAFEEFYNRTASSKLPKIMGVNERRRKLVRAVIKEHGKGSIVEVLNYVVNSPWHTGANDRGWTADFDWIFNSKNFLRLLDKSRDNGASNHQIGGNSTNPGGIQNQFSDYLRENFGFNGTAEEFEEWFNKEPYGS